MERNTKNNFDGEVSKTIPDWLWLVVGVVFGTAMFFVGHYTGRIDADKCPSEHAWINVRRYSVEANAEVQKRAIEAEHEERMAMIERGVFDVGEDGTEEGEPS